MPIVAPLLIELAPFFSALAVLLGLVAYHLLLKPAVNALGEQIPVIGHWIKSAVTGIVNLTVGEWGDAFGGIEHVVSGWIGGLTDLLDHYTEIVQRLALVTATTIDHAVHITVHEIVKAFLEPVRIIAVRALNRADDTMDYAKREVTVLAHARDVVNVQIRDVIMPGLVHIIATDIPHVIDRIDAQAARITHDIIPEIRHARDKAQNAIDRFEDWVHGINREILIATILAVPIIATQIATVVMPEINLVKRCRSKIRAACEIDENLLGSLVGDLMPVLGIAALPIIIKAAQELAPQIGDELRQWEQDRTNVGG